MNTKSRILSLLTCCALLLPVCGVGLVSEARARSGQRRGADDEPRAGETVNRDKVSGALRERAAGGGRRGKDAGPTAQVILQLRAPMSGGLVALLNRNGAHVTRELKSLGMATADLPLSALDELASFDEVTFVSPDQETEVLGHVSRATGADAAVAQTYSSVTQLNGTGVAIAVVDSGIYDAHASFLDAAGTASRVVFNKNFVTTETRTDDPYGHGTHVAGLAAGLDRVKGGAYSGVATDARIIDLRVLDSKGKGQTSWLLGALDWLAANHAAYNVRVVNISLGAPAVDSYANDPVCQAVRRLYHLGLVVVVAAGNNGKNSAGQKVYGQIHSPGNDPSVITVGASNAFGTDARADDAIATYSSRGPTRSFWTDAQGAKHHDNLIKPDLVAPGNKIIDAAAEDNYLLATNPWLDAGVSNSDKRRMMYMNGTSMATPVTAGAAALLLQANPRLTPNMVKMILMYTAQPLAGFNMLEQGAGELNVEGAVRLARLVR
ncbi:MAG TPA: S8 family serine peptidase, partial [Pyrinomonadaceae bacterium]